MFDNPVTDPTEQKKAAALSFSGGGLYISLKISTRANSRIVAIEEFPGLTTIIAKNRIRLIGYDRQYKIRVCKESARSSGRMRAMTTLPGHTSGASRTIRSCV